MAIRVHKDDIEKLNRVLDRLSMMGMDYVNGRFSRSGMDCYDEVMQILDVLKEGEHWCNKSYNGEW